MSLSKVFGRLLVFAAVTVLCSAANADIVTYTVSFTRITANASVDIASQLSAEIIGDTEDAGKVLFKLMLTSDGDASTNPWISDVFFEDGPLKSIVSLGDVDDSITFANFLEHTGVDYTHPGNQKNLPGAENASPEFVAGQNLTADPDTPDPKTKAISEGKYLGVLFELDSGKTFDDVLTAMRSTTNPLRIGYHVQALAAGKSDSFVSNPLPPPPTILFSTAPEPASIAAWGLGLIGVVCIRSFRRRAAR